jgi:hypothetical protein
VRTFALWFVLIAAPCLAHDVSVDVSAAGTAPSPDNPRTGSLGVSAAGSYDFNDRWSLTGMAVFTRDLATRTGESFSPGSNVFLFSLGAMWLPTDSLMTMLTVSGSPPVDQRNATTVVGPLGRSTDVVVVSRTWSFGAVWNGLWSSSGLSDFEHTIDVTLGFNRFSVIQKLALPNTITGNLLREACAENRPLEVCPLVRGVASPLWQGRLGAGYTATLFTRTDVGLDATYFVYDTPPADVGYFSLVSLGRELGSGVPVLPLQLSVRPHVAHRFGPVTVKLTYQYGLYAQSLGALHALTARASWKVTREWRVSLSLTGQLDASGGVVSNRGGQALAGVLYAW